MMGCMQAGMAKYLKLRHLSPSHKLSPAIKDAQCLFFFASGDNLWTTWFQHQFSKAKIFLKKQLSLSINTPKERLKSVARGGWILTVTNEAVQPLQPLSPGTTGADLCLRSLNPAAQQKHRLMDRHSYSPTLLRIICFSKTKPKPNQST